MGLIRTFFGKKNETEIIDINKREDLKKKLIIGGIAGAVAISPTFATDLVFNPFTHQPDMVNNDVLLLELMYNNAYSTGYIDFTKDIDDNITAVNVWENSGKVIKLFTKDITYTGENITEVLITDEVTNKTMLKEINYDVDGNVTDITITYN